LAAWTRPHIFAIVTSYFSFALPCRTDDKAKLDYIKLWLKYLVDEKKTVLPPNLTSGIQLMNLQPEVKDGFLTLIVPMLQQRSELDIAVHSRPSPAEPGAYDLRIKILNMKKGPNSIGGGAAATSSSPVAPITTPKKRISSSSILETLGLASLASPNRGSTPVPMPPSFSSGGGFPLSAETPPRPPEIRTRGTSSGGSALGSSPSSVGSGGPGSAGDRRLRKGVLASRIEERLAALQQQEQRERSASHS